MCGWKISYTSVPQVYGINTTNMQVTTFKWRDTTGIAQLVVCMCRPIPGPDSYTRGIRTLLCCKFSVDHWPFRHIEMSAQRIAYSSPTTREVCHGNGNKASSVGQGWIPKSQFRWDLRSIYNFGPSFAICRLAHFLTSRTFVYFVSFLRFR